MNRRPTPEPFLWMLFSSGGMVAALMVPILLFLFGIAFPLDLLSAPSQAHLYAVLHNWITRLVLFGLCVLALFHWAHRFRYFLFDLGLHGGRQAIAVICYGVAVLGSLAAILMLYQL